MTPREALAVLSAELRVPRQRVWPDADVVEALSTLSWALDVLDVLVHFAPRVADRAVAVASEYEKDSHLPNWWTHLADAPRSRG